VSVILTLLQSGVATPLVILDPNVASLFHGPFASSPPFLFIGSFNLSFIDPNLEHNENVIMSLTGSPCLLEKVCFTSDQNQQLRTNL
jgi:hypothetical protein